MPKEVIKVPGGTVHFAWQTGVPGIGAVYAPDVNVWEAAATAALTAAVTSALAGSPSVAKLDLLLAKVGLLQANVTTMETEVMADLTALKQEVNDTVGAEASALTLIQGIEAQLQAAIANGNSQADIDALAQQLATERQALASAVASNPAPTA